MRHLPRRTIEPLAQLGSARGALIIDSSGMREEAGQGLGPSGKPGSCKVSFPDLDGGAWKR
jgi:hypothetical protein